MRPKILVVDDRPENIVAFSQLLRTYGADVLEASSGTEALEVLLTTEVALALLDVQMPEMNGYELATLMRGSERTRDIPIIFVTAGAVDEARVLEGYDVGCVDFLVKPIEPRTLENKVSTFLRLYSQTRELADAERRLQAMLGTVRASERRLRAMAESMPQLVWTADADGSVDYFNSRIFEYVACPKPDTGWRWQSLVHADDLEGTTRAWNAAVSSGESYSWEHRLCMADGAPRWHLSRARLVRGENGTPDKWFGTSTDIHDRKRAELLSRENEVKLTVALESAELAIGARDQVVSIVSHDLRNPLGVLRTTTALVRATLEAQGSSEVKQRCAAHLARMDRQITRMDKLLDELLDVAKLQTGQLLTLERRPTDLVALTRELTEEHARSSPEHRFDLRTSLSELRGEWDPRRLEQVVNNLLANAVKYSPQGSSIVVQIDRCEERDEARIRVIDEGVGIPRDERERIFEWFARARNVEGRVPGTGIGLAGARQIVEQHGGTIRVESEEGVGSTFVVYLPTGARASVERAPTSHRAARF